MRQFLFKAIAAIIVCTMIIIPFNVFAENSSDIAVNVEKDFFGDYYISDASAYEYAKSAYPGAWTFIQNETCRIKGDPTLNFEYFIEKHID